MAKVSRLGCSTFDYVLRIGRSSPTSSVSLQTFHNPSHGASKQSQRYDDTSMYKIASILILFAHSEKGDTMEVPYHSENKCSNM